MKSLKPVFVIKLLLLLGSLFFIQTSLAHAKLASTNPPAHAVLQASPNELVLTFSESIELGFSQFTIMNSKHHAIMTAKPSLDATNRNQVHIQLIQPLPADVYEVQWRVLSVDGHKTHGSYDFTVK